MAAVVLDMAQVLNFVSHPQYQFYDAAQSIRAIVDEAPATHRLLLEQNWRPIVIMTGIPANNDGYTSQDLAQKVSLYQPGWYLGWNEMDQDILDSLSAFRLDQVASFPVFDLDKRNRLILYRMVPLKETRK